MRENCTYGSMRGRAFPTGRPALLYTLGVPSRKNRERKSATDSKIGSSFVPDWASRKVVGCANLSLNRDVLSRLFHIM